MTLAFLLIGMILMIVAYKQVLSLINQILKEGLQMAFGVGTGLIMIWVIHFFIQRLYPDPIITVGLAIIIASPPYFTKIFPYCTHMVPDDKTWVIANRFKNESNSEHATFSGYRTITAQRECAAGFHWTWPWEVATKSVDMTRTVQITNPPDDIYTLADGNVVLIKWRVIYAPLPGNIVHYIRSRPDLIKTQISDRVTRWLTGRIGSLTKDQLGFGKDQQERLITDFEGVFGGRYNIDEEIERPGGVWTSTVEILSIDQIGSVQQLNAFFNAIAEAIENSKRVNPNNPLTYEQAQNLVLANNAKGVDLNLLRFN